jgi:hypothetical protein
LRPAVWRWSVALLPLLCVLLGGGTARWSQGIILVLLGALIACSPPRTSLGWKINLVLAGLAALALTAYLPASWFSRPAWRAMVEDDFRIALPSTVTPQPWITAESGVLFLAGICWFYLMATLNWNAGERLRAGRLFAIGVVALSAVILVLFKLDVLLPIWPNERHFGPFPNRNQTADFLAVGALPVLACAQLAFRGGRIAAAIGWIVGWLVVALAAYSSFSRAGVILLVLGTVFCLGVQARNRSRDGAQPAPGAAEANGVAPPAARKVPRRRSRTPAKPNPLAGMRITENPIDRWRGVALGISLLAILLSFFMLFGGDTLQRMTPGSSPVAAAGEPVTDFRVRIQGDALRMMLDAPWCGLGLGNFESVFPVFRVSSAIPERAVHPESDWLWMAAELGWPSLLLIVSGIVLLVPGIWPWRRAGDHRLRMAAAIAVGMFAIHSVVDVSAHRLGTCMCAMFVLSLALRTEADGTVRFRLPARWTAPVFRLLAGALIAVGIAWIAEARGVVVLPGEQGIVQLQEGAVNVGNSRDYADVASDIGQALKWAPLSWNLYFTRGAARLYAGENMELAAADFRRARYLEPFLGSLPFDEARVWLSTGHSALAVHALVEACQREPGHAGEYVDGVYSVAPHNALFRSQLWEIALKIPLLTLPFLNELEPPDSGQFIAACVQANPDLDQLSAGQKTKFFRFWAQRGDSALLAETIARHPAWQRLGWRWWAEACARNGGLEQACGIASRFAPKPVLPSVADIQAAAGGLELSDYVAPIPGDTALALKEYVTDRKAGDLPHALTTARRITVSAAGPAYFHYLEADTAAELGDWTASWKAWQDYLAATNVQESL